MSTNLEQSQRLEQMARGIEKSCPVPWDELWDNTHPSSCCCKGSGIIRPYDRDGTAGWLGDRPCETCKGAGGDRDGFRLLQGCLTCQGSGKRGSEWPSLCIVERQGHEPYISWQKDGLTADSMPHKVWHILEDTDAFALLEEAIGGYWERTKAVATGKDIYEWFKQEKQIAIANSPGELLDKIMVEEARHGAADGR